MKMQPIYRDYKETELGFLPREWTVIKLGDLAQVIRGASPRPKGDSRYYGGNVPRLMVADVSRDNKYVTPRIDSLTEEGAKRSRRMKKGDVIIQVSGNPGTPCILNVDCCIHDGFAGLLNLKQDRINNEYLFYYLTYVKDQNSRLAFGSTFKNLQTYAIEKFKIPLPDISEQEQISSVLSTIQEAQEKSKNVIGSLKELKKSLMKYLSTYGAVMFEEAEETTLKETEIGTIPDSWEVEKLANLVKKTQQKDMRKQNIEFKYVDVSGIDRNLSEITSFSLFRGKESPSRARKIIETNDVIIATVRPTLKRIAMVSEEFDNQVCSTAFCVLRANESLNPKYLFYAIQRDNFIEGLGKIQKGASYPAVSDSDVKNQKIIVPSISEQQEIASILFSVDEKIFSQEKKRKALFELFKSMLSDLMSAKIRVVNAGD